MSNNRRILVVSGIYPPDIGGPATYVPQLCSQLHDQNNDVRLVSLTDEVEAKRNEEPWKRTFILRKLWKPLRILRTLHLLFNEGKKADAIFANGLYEEVGIISLVLRKKRIIANVVGDPVWERFINAQNKELMIEDFIAAQQNKKTHFQRKLLTWSLNRFTEITCPSEQLKELITSWRVKRPVSVIHNGVMCKPVTQKMPLYDIVTVSRLVKWKNLDKLIAATEGKDYVMAICGDGPEMQSLKELGEKKKSKIHFFGQVTADQISKIISESKVFALLSTYEGLSFALLEAMMAGKGILVSNARGNKDVIKNRISGLVVDPSNIQEISRALELLLNDEQKSHQLSTKAHEIAVTNYCAEKQLAKMITLIGS